jgi:hypothetical protein
MYKPSHSSFLITNMSRLVEGIKSSLTYFQKVSLVHIKREVNTTAHGLAREVVTHIVDKIWIKEISFWIYDIGP